MALARIPKYYLILLANHSPFFQKEIISNWIQTADTKADWGNHWAVHTAINQYLQVLFAINTFTSTFSEFDPDGPTVSSMSSDDDDDDQSSHTAEKSFTNYSWPLMTRFDDILAPQVWYFLSTAHN